MDRPFTIAVSGKGGTGKTTVSSLLVRSFIEAGEGPVLAVDADPNANLNEALGVPVRETLGAMREEAFSRSIPPGMNRHQYVMYRFRQALVESDGFDLIAMGRPEGSGCYCFANDLLSECMQQLERDYRFIVIDTEAGMEHIARGTIGKPDLLLIVSDPGARGMRTIARIRGIAVSLGLEPEKIHTVINRYQSGTAPVDTMSEAPIAVLPDDPAVTGSRCGTGIEDSRGQSRSGFRPDTCGEDYRDAKVENFIKPGDCLSDPSSLQGDAAWVCPRSVHFSGKSP